MLLSLSDNRESPLCKTTLFFNVEHIPGLDNVLIDIDLYRVSYLIADTYF